ncbi:MAG: T9SS type A sorting domain-containing protein [Ignavibacteriaceae bacterium]|nr:T9SS type A sorting domain-containing protein [Ignavibacteriaceae bacterium]
MKVIILIVLFAFSFCNAQWEQKNNGLPSSWLGFSIDANDTSTAIISVSGPSALYKTTDGGDSWLQLPSPVGELIVDVEMLDEKIWGATDWGRIIYSADGGKKWSVQFVDSSITDFMNYVEMFDENNGVAMGDVYAGNPTNNPGPALFLKTTDGGTNWVSVNNSAFGGISGDTWRRLDFVSMNIGYFRESGGDNSDKLYKTTDGCVTWTSLPLSASQVVLIKFYDEQTGIASYSNNYISRTSDGGLNWETFTSPIGWGNDFEYQPGAPSNIWAVDKNNLYFSSNMGLSWVTEETPLSQLKGRDLVFTSDKSAWLLCDGAVLRNVNVSKIVTTGENTAEIIWGYSLEQNYPNPFNPTTNIKFTLPSPSQGEGPGVRSVTLKVYDLLGREITTLVNKELAAGSYVVNFDAKDLGSGIYFYKLNVGSFSQTKKMIVLK